MHFNPTVERLENAVSETRNTFLIEVLGQLRSWRFSRVPRICIETLNKPKEKQLRSRGDDDRATARSAEVADAWPVTRSCSGAIKGVLLFGPLRKEPGRNPFDRMSSTSPRTTVTECSDDIFELPRRRGGKFGRIRMPTQRGKTDRNNLSCRAN